METVGFLVLVLSGLCVVNTALSLRLVERMRAQDTMREHHGGGSGSALAIGVPAPPFRAMTLAGQEITEARLAGQAVVFVFVSPNCGTCRSTLAALADLAVLARKAAGVEVIVVSDGGSTRTREWLDSVRYEDDVTIVQPVLAAPLSRTPMIADFNPHGVFPSFCLLDENHRVRAYGLFGRPEWDALVQSWRSAADRGGPTRTSRNADAR